MTTDVQGRTSGPVYETQNPKDVPWQTLAANLERAPEPGVHESKQVGDGPAAGEIQGRHVTSAGWYYLYRAATGVKVPVNGNMLAQKLSIKLPDGRAAWLPYPPQGVVPKRGTFICWLHKDSEHRVQADEFGLPVCRKSNLVSPTAVRTHMRRKHPTAYAVLQEVKQTKEKNEDRAYQHAIMEALAGKTATPAAVMAETRDEEPGSDHEFVGGGAPRHRRKPQPKKGGGY